MNRSLIFVQVFAGGLTTAPTFLSELTTVTEAVIFGVGLFVAVCLAKEATHKNATHITSFLLKFIV
jgi:hypothetical protein